MKTTLSSLAVFTALIFSHSAYSASFCEGRVGHYGGGYTYEGNLTSLDCLEIGAGEGYAGLGTNLNMLEDSIVSVVGYLENSTVNNGATLWISKKYKVAVNDYNPDLPAMGTNVDIKTGALVRVLDGGTLKDSFINGGTVHVSNENGNEAGYSIGNTINSGGKLYIYLGGQAEDTVVNNGGTLYVYSGTDENVTLAVNNTINSGGKSYVYLNGKAQDTTINTGGIEYVQQSGHSVETKIDGGKQYVQSSGIASGATVNDGGYQYVFNTGVAQDTIVNSGGTQYLYMSGSATEAGKAYNTKVYGTGVQRIQNGATAVGVELYDDAIQRISIDSSAENVTINNNAQSLLNAGAQILGTTRIHDWGLLQLNASGSTTTYAKNVVLNGSGTSVYVMAGSTDTDSVSIGSLSGSGRVLFRTANEESTGDVVYSHLYINDLSGNMHFRFNTSIEGGRGDHLTILQSSSGEHIISVADSGFEIADGDAKILDLVTDVNGDANFSLMTLERNRIGTVDGGTYMYTLNNRTESAGEIWYLTTGNNGGSTTEPDPDPTPDPDTDTDTGETVPPVINPETTPSTDAVLSMSVAPQLIFNNEMQNLRFRKGALQQNEGDAGAWVRMTDGRSHIGSGHTHFKLEQFGMEIGADKVVNFENGKAFLGGFTSYNGASVKHERGGSSSINSYSIGTYASYFDNSGFYVDSVLKYNYFKNELKAVSTNGSGINGSYDQNAFGASLEAGYNAVIAGNMWIEPYAKLSYVQVESKDISLSNGMKASIGTQDSLSTELGFNFGKNFSVGNSSVVTPYVKAAWIHEYVDNNSTVINGRNKFTTDLSGDVGKVGVGVNAKMNKQMTLFTEFDYAKGGKLETPIQGNFGVRYSF